MRYRLLASGFMLALGPLIGTTAAMEPSGEQDCKDNNCYVIADCLQALFTPFYEACQLDMAGAPQGTTARRNVAATATAVLQTAEPPTRVAAPKALVEASKPSTQTDRRYERRFSGLRLARR